MNNRKSKINQINLKLFEKEKTMEIFGNVESTKHQTNNSDLANSRSNDLINNRKRNIIKFNNPQNNNKTIKN